MSEAKTFFSYSRTDSEFVLKLAKDLRDAGAELWLDQLDIKPGSHWDSSIEKALNNATQLIVVLSPASVGSNNVMDEVSYALENNKIVIPVLFQECATPFRIRRLHRVDFTGDYTTGLNKLLISLGYEAKGTLITGGENQEDENLWNETITKYTIAAFKNYLVNGINESYINEARLKIKDLESLKKDKEIENQVWNKIRAQNTVEAYNRYLELYPNGNYKSMAKAALKLIDKDKDENGQYGQQTFNLEEKDSSIKTKIFIGIGVFILVGIIIMILKKDAGNVNANTDSSNQDTSALLYDSVNAIPDSTSMPASQGTSTEDKKSVDSSTNRLKPLIRFVARPDSIYIGAKYQGGIIFYIRKSGEAGFDPKVRHGLIVSPSNQSKNSNWSEAEKLCKILKIGNYDDWYLPNYNELKLLYLNKDKIGGLVDVKYWTSLSDNSIGAYIIDFSNGDKVIGNKNGNNEWGPTAVRAIRAF